MKHSLLSPALLDFMIRNGIDREYTSKDIADSLGVSVLRVRPCLGQMSRKRSFLYRVGWAKKEGSKKPWGLYKINKGMLPAIAIAVRKGGFNLDEFVSGNFRKA